MRNYPTPTNFGESELSGQLSGLFGQKFGQKFGQFVRKQTAPVRTSNSPSQDIKQPLLSIQIALLWTPKLPNEERRWCRISSG